MSSISGPSGYVFETLGEYADFTLCRGRQNDNPSPVLAIALSAEHPSPHRLGQLEQYSLAAELDSARAARPLAFTRHEGRTILLLKDPGGQPLDLVLERDEGQPLDLTRFLRIAIGLTTALGQASRRGLIHKDIKPANVLEPPEIVAGTLPYVAREQTGRMNRSIDDRSGPVLVGVQVDYRQNVKLFEQVYEDSIL